MVNPCLVQWCSLEISPWNSPINHHKPSFTGVSLTVGYISIPNFTKFHKIPLNFMEIPWNGSVSKPIVPLFCSHQNSWVKMDEFIPLKMAIFIGIDPQIPPCFCGNVNCPEESPSAFSGETSIRAPLLGCAWHEGWSLCPEENRGFHRRKKNGLL